MKFTLGILLTMLASFVVLAERPDRETALLVDAILNNPEAVQKLSDDDTTWMTDVVKTDDGDNKTKYTLIFQTQGMMRKTNKLEISVDSSRITTCGSSEYSYTFIQ